MYATPQWEEAFLDVDNNDYPVETGLFLWWKNVSNCKAVRDLPTKNWEKFQEMLGTALQYMRRYNTYAANHPSGSREKWWQIIENWLEDESYHTGPWRINVFFGIRTGHSTIIYVTTG